jgi:hypothetical protein
MENLKIKKLLFNKLLVTANQPASKIILSKEDNNTRTIKEVQTVVAAGPFCTSEGGSGILVGDKVVLDPIHLKATQIAINKITGEYIEFTDYEARLNKDELDFYLLINDRDVIMVIE